MITEDHVSPEIAKLLKERGFDEGCSFVINTISKGVMPVFWPTTNSDIEDEKASLIALPTLQMAMKWLREVHHIYIQINLYLVPKGYGADIIHIDSMDTLAYVRKEDESQYDTYEQAAEAAIKYYLENLI